LYETLQVSEDRLRSVLNATEIVAWEANTVEGKLFEAGPVGKLFGRSEEFLHPEVSDFAQSIHPEDRDRVIESIDRALRGEGSYDVEFRIPLTDGSVRWIGANGSLMKKTEGKPDRLLGIARDITDQKQAEEEIRRLNQELEQRVKNRTAQLEAANKELEAFAYSVSHDLRAPLRHIDGFVELLKNNLGTTLDKKGRNYMSTISASAHKMGQLIDDLLSFSRIGRLEIRLVSVNLEVIVRDIIREIKPDTDGRNIEWQINKLPIVNGDSSMLRVVMMNLLSNAVKFTRTREEAVIEAGCESREGETVVFVRDNGVGFDKKYMDKLFGVFNRLHSADEFEGTGVGLAIVQRIIHRHGGRVWAEGEVDKGAAFYFSLPQR
jgi:PAS domain S-box-containing protein